jgi:hypothetical protein
MSKLRCCLYALAIVVSISPVLPYQVIHELDPDESRRGENILWTDPGDVASLDFDYGVGGREHQPQPPFRFLGEDMSGTIAKVNVTDNRGTTWNVKFGREAHASVFCSRLLWACGYFAEIEYFVAQGYIEGAHGLKRAGSHVHDDGSFQNARFQLRTESPKYLSGHSWAWTNNPFSGTRAFQGFKILVLLVSNWDTKDSRDFTDSHGSRAMDSNLAIFEDDRFGHRRYLYADVDWGASLGKWGNTLSWSKWDCRGFAQQTPMFVKGVENSRLQWGFTGKHRKDVTAEITVDDVKWLLQYLGRISDHQIQRGLAASGANQRESDCYLHALRERVEQLRRAVDGV